VQTAEKLTQPWVWSKQPPVGHVQVLTEWVLLGPQLQLPIRHVSGKSEADKQQSDAVTVPPVVEQSVLGSLCASVPVPESGEQPPVHSPNWPLAWHTQVVHALIVAVSPT